MLALAYAGIVVARLLLDHLDLRPSGAAASLHQGAHAVTEPVLRGVRSVAPPVRTGAVDLDLAPVLLLVALVVLAALFLR